jgi:hypothetical protein
MSMHKRLLPLSSALVLGAMVVPQANASLKYAAKFVCGPVPFEVPPNQGGGGTPTFTAALPTEMDAVVGAYLTAINIHNPQDSPVTFMKKVVRAHEEPPKGVSPKLDASAPFPVTLGADVAEFVDCNVIYGLLGLKSPLPHIEGFVVLEVPEDPDTGAFNFLDVVGKYTARSPNIGGTSSPALEIVVYSPTIIP